MTTRDYSKFNFIRSASETGELVARKFGQYGPTVYEAGDLVAKLYPRGVPVKHLPYLSLIFRIFDKLGRFAQQEDPTVHPGNESPWVDLAGYTNLGLELNNYECSQKATGENTHRGTCTLCSKREWVLPLGTDLLCNTCAAKVRGLAATQRGEAHPYDVPVSFVPATDKSPAFFRCDACGMTTHDRSQALAHFELFSSTERKALLLQQISLLKEQLVELHKAKDDENAPICGECYKKAGVDFPLDTYVLLGGFCSLECQRKTVARLNGEDQKNERESSASAPEQAEAPLNPPAPPAPKEEPAPSVEDHSDEKVPEEARRQLLAWLAKAGDALREVLQVEVAEVLEDKKPTPAKDYPDEIYGDRQSEALYEPSEAEEVVPLRLDPATGRNKPIRTLCPEQPDFLSVGALHAHKRALHPWQDGGDK